MLEQIWRVGQPTAAHTAYLCKSNLSRILSETLPACVEPVLSDQAMPVATDSAVGLRELIIGGINGSSCPEEISSNQTSLLGHDL